MTARIIRFTTPGHVPDAVQIKERAKNPLKKLPVGATVICILCYRGQLSTIIL